MLPPTLRPARPTSTRLSSVAINRSSAFFTIKTLLVLLSIVALVPNGGMCFGLDDAPLMSGRDPMETRRSNAWMPVPMENVMHEPQPLSANRMMMKLIGEAATPSGPTAHPSHWRLHGHGQSRNMAWERLGWGW
ncbi:hypothetical protein M3Y99_01458100 [Aphelenchoides fujianensis]|nr:hypothetical protein M3Y99_01458100 [Aphelenchoides fujianensis]